MRVPVLTGLEGRWGDLPGVTAADLSNGSIFDARTLSAWVQAAEAGQAVPVTLHNRVVASLALAGDLIALGPVAPEAMTAHFVAALPDDQTALRIGAAPFTDGDITAPVGTAPAGIIVRPAGAAATPPATPPPSTASGTITVTTAERRAQWEQVRGVLNALRVTQESLRYDPNAAVAPAGALPALAALATPTVIVIVAGIAAYAAYSAYVNGHRITEAQVTERLRIQENAHTARAGALIAAQSAAYSLRFEEWKRTGRMPPPAPFENQTAPIAPTTQNGAQPQQPDWLQGLTERTVSSLTWGAIALGGVGGAVLLAEHLLTKWLARRATSASSEAPARGEPTRFGP